MAALSEVITGLGILLERMPNPKSTKLSNVTGADLYTSAFRLSIDMRVEFDCYLGL